MTNANLKESVESVLPVDPNATGEIVTAGPRWIKAVLGVTPKALASRGMKGVGGKYDLREFWEKFGDTVSERRMEKIAESSEGEGGHAAVKLEKTREEVRKLKIENDLKEGRTINADDAIIEWAKELKAICDVLDSIPSIVKMENPDISQSVLDSVYRAVVTARNKAARVDD